MVQCGDDTWAKVADFRAKEQKPSSYVENLGRMQPFFSHPTL